MTAARYNSRKIWNVRFIRGGSASAFVRFIDELPFCASDHLDRSSEKIVKINDTGKHCLKKKYKLTIFSQTF